MMPINRIRTTAQLLIRFAVGTSFALVSVLVSGNEALPCAVSSDTKLPLFGDLHIHTRYSFDSFLSNQKNDPDGAYEYAKGQVITLPDAYGDKIPKW